MPKAIAVLGLRRLVNSELVSVFSHDGCRLWWPFFLEPCHTGTSILKSCLLW